MTNPQQVIDGLVCKVLRAELTPQEGVKAMSAAIGGLTAVEFHEGKKFKLVNHCAKYSVNYSGIKRKEMHYLHALAALGYDLARSEGNYSQERCTSQNRHRQNIIEQELRIS